ncbi:MAG TPA: alpha/beta fold hydrolase [Gaiella sp.]|nr:alpha/beta fold hydrolase [Gaiella sp.]
MNRLRTARVGGLQIAYERVGDGPATLLLHGGLADHRAWGPQLELADELTLVAWDAPGCGGSSDPTEPFRMEDYAAALAGFVVTLGLECAHVVGHSFGATLAIELALLEPARARSLVLASPYAGWAGSLPPAAVAERVEHMLGALEQGPAALAAGFVETLFSANADPGLLAQAREMVEDVRASGARAMLHAMAGCDLRDRLDAVDAPTLVLHGSEDVRAPAHVARAIHEAIPGSRLTVVDGIGHECNLEAPAAFNAAVRSFLRDVDGR